MSDTNEKVKKEQEEEVLGSKEKQPADEDPKQEQLYEDDSDGDTESNKQSEEIEQLKEQYKGLETDELIELLIERDRLISDLDRQLQSARDARLRKAAELENMKKRIQRDRAQMFETARANALEDFLPINDDLRRTLKAFDESEVNQNFMDGVELVANKFEEVLNKYGVERIDEEGVPFDVDLHDAMMSQKPEDDSIESDMVLQVLENGYRMGDRTIRHAKVIVSE